MRRSVAQVNESQGLSSLDSCATAVCDDVYRSKPGPVRSQTQSDPLGGLIILRGFPRCRSKDMKGRAREYEGRSERVESCIVASCKTITDPWASLMKANRKCRHSSVPTADSFLLISVYCIIICRVLHIVHTVCALQRNSPYYKGEGLTMHWRPTDQNATIQVFSVVQSCDRAFHDNTNSWRESIRQQTI
jgi:hypothetical protein